MNLELPFDAPEPAELDARLARIDRELDALFLEDVRTALAAARQTPPADAAA